MIKKKSKELENNSKNCIYVLAEVCSPDIEFDKTVSFLCRFNILNSCFN